MANNKLREILDNEGIRQSEIVQKSGVSTTTVGRLVRGTRSASPATYGKVIRALNQLSGKEFTVEQIFEDEKPPKTPQKRRTSKKD